MSLRIRTSCTKCTRSLWCVQLLARPRCTRAHACRRVPQRVRMAGWLYKQADVLRDWRLRFFVLTGYELRYHRSMRREGAGDVLAVVVPLRGCQVRVFKGDGTPYVAAAAQWNPAPH